MKLATPLGGEFLLIERLRAHEGLSQLFRYELELLHEEPEEGSAPTPIDPQRMLGQAMSVAVAEDNAEHRYFHGMCVNFSQGNRNTHFSKYRAEIVPRAWLLTQVSRSRIFQQKSVPDILRKVFEDLEVNFEIQGTFNPRNYCVQYRESDWDFASRLMEEEGIFYYFEHTADSHKMIVANTAQSHRDCPTRSTFPFTLNLTPIDEGWMGGVHTWRVDSQLRSGKYTLWDHNFELPTANLEAAQLSRFDIGGNQNLEVYDYPGEYAKRFDGVDPGGGDQQSNLQKVFDDRQRTVQIRQQEIDVAYKNIYASSDAYPMTAGYRFVLENHPEANGSYVLVDLQIEAVQSPAYITDNEIPDSYLVNFVCMPQGETAAPFRPLRKTKKPVINGSQTAVVVGPPGEEIFTDKYGRVKVQFHWDREGHSDSDSSCWIRVVTPWAGKQWGAVHIPRVGMEVIVGFMEGDPDQPIITGAVYNPNTMPPYALPDQKTRSTLKSNSSKGGSGFNEIRFEDKAGEEQVFINAQKDHDQRVGNDSKEAIGRDRHMIVERDQFELVKKDKHLQVKGNHAEKIDGSMSLKIGTSTDLKTGTKLAADAGTEIHLKAGTTAVIEAGVSLTLKVGGNFININPAGVFIKGVMVMLNSGGAAGTGSGSSPETPKDALDADKSESGKKAEASSSPPPREPTEFKAMAALARGPTAPDGSSPQPPAAPAFGIPPVPSLPASVGEAQQAAQLEAAAIEEQVRQQIAAVEQTTADQIDAAQAMADDLAQNAQQYADEAAERAADARSQAEALAERAKSTAEGAKNAVDGAEEKAEEAKQAIADAKQTAQEKIDEAKQAIDDAKQTAQEAKETAAAAGDAVSDAASSLVQSAQDAIPFS